MRAATTKVREVYIGSGAAEIAAKPRASAALATPLLTVDKVDTFYGKSHILNGVSLEVREQRDRRPARPQRRRQVDPAEDPDRHRAAGIGSITLAGESTQRLSSAEIARRGMGYVPQGRGLFTGMSVADNLALGRLKRRTGARHPLGRRAGAAVLPAAARALAHAGRLSVRRRAADGGGRPRARRRRARAHARRAVRRAVAGGDRGTVRGVRPAAPRRSRC